MWFPKKINYEKPSEALLLGKQTLYRDSCPSAILKDYFGAARKRVRQLRKWLWISVYV